MEFLKPIISKKLLLSLLVHLGYGPGDITTCKKILFTLHTHPELTLSSQHVQLLQDKNMIDWLVQLCLDYDSAHVLHMINDARVLPQNDLNAIYFDACKEGRLNIVKYLIENGYAAVNQSTIHQTSGLAIAASHDQDDIVQYLFDAGANINLPNLHGLTPLALATIRNFPLMVFLLTILNANKEKRTSTGRTPLCIAAANKQHLEILKILIRTGANVNATDNDGLTPLDYAAKENNTKAIRLLLDNNAERELHHEIIWPIEVSERSLQIMRFIKTYVPSLKTITREKIYRLLYRMENQEEHIAKYLPTDLIEELLNNAERPLLYLMSKYQKELEKK